MKVKEFKELIKPKSFLYNSEIILEVDIMVGWKFNLSTSLTNIGIESNPKQNGIISLSNAFNCNCNINMLKYVKDLLNISPEYDDYDLAIDIYGLKENKIYIDQSITIENKLDINEETNTRIIRIFPDKINIYTDGDENYIFIAVDYDKPIF